MKRHVPAIAFGLLALTLLIGRQVGFPWAGGAGIPDVLAASVGDHAYHRGETVSTGETGATLHVGPVTAELGPRTDVELESLVRGDLILRLRRGRLLVTASPEVPGISVTTNATESHILTSGSLEVVDYDFKNLVTVKPIGTAVGVMLKDGQAFVATEPQEITEWPTVSVKAVPPVPTH